MIASTFCAAVTTAFCLFGTNAVIAEPATVSHLELSAFATVPCALGGVGENVLVEGRITTVTRFSTDSAGGTRARVHSHYHQFSGTGLTSGTHYRVR